MLLVISMSCFEVLNVMLLLVLNVLFLVVGWSVFICM